MSTTEIKCPICFSIANFYREVIGNINVSKDKNTYILYRCRRCKHIFRTNLLNKHIYDKNYYSYSASKNWSFSIIKYIYLYSRFPVINLLWSIIQNTTRYQNCPYVENGTVLDIGGGDGFALNLYLLSNNKTYNIEILDRVIKLSKRNDHRTVRNINQIKGVTFDLIRVNHVLEHLEDPSDIIKKSHALLKGTGKIVIGIPNIHSISFKLLGDKFDQLSFPDHIHFFSEESLKILLKRFKKVKIVYPLHKYGFLTNIWTILSKKIALLNNAIFYPSIIMLSFPVNLGTKIFKATHFIDVHCYKE